MEAGVHLLVTVLFGACTAASHARMGTRQTSWFSQRSWLSCAEVAGPGNSSGKVMGIRCWASVHLVWPNNGLLLLDSLSPLEGTSWCNHSSPDGMLCEDGYAKPRVAVDYSQDSEVVGLFVKNGF